MGNGGLVPKVVDHEARRARLVEAVWALTVRAGLEGVTLRGVAAEAGVSMGQVQHYYPSMAALIADALDRCVRAVHTKLEASLAEIVDPDPGLVLRRCLRAVVAPDEEAVRLIRFSVAALGRSISDPAVATVFTPGDDDLLDFTAGLIAAARPAGARSDRLDADLCWALAVGLGVDVAIGHRTAGAALELLDYQVDQVLG